MPVSTPPSIRHIVPRLPKQLPPLVVPKSPYSFDPHGTPEQLVLVKHREMDRWVAQPLPRGVFVMFERNWHRPMMRPVTAYKGAMLTVTGPLGTVRRRICGDMAIIQDGKVATHMMHYRSMKERKMQSMTTAKCISNMVYGVCCGWSKTVRLFGKGFRVAVAEDDPRRIIMRAGYRKPLEFWAPEGTSFEVLEPDDNGYPIKIRGVDIEQIGNVAASLRRVKRMNKQGQGVRYDGEERRVASKKGRR